jgi:alkyldihydroxyacetonephosphate synthase
MRRWNGWGDEAVSLPVPGGAAAFLERLIGPGAVPRDASLDDVLRAVPRTRLPAHPLVSDDPLNRLRHARGQSLPDWVAVRSGRIGPIPDGVAQPATDEEVRGILRYSADAGVQVIPYWGGTSVVGHVNPLAGQAPVLTIDLARLAGLRRFDAVSGLATFGGGTSGPDVEAQLRARDVTLGHFPQSFEYSTLGGWIATRSSGQQSIGYGRIDQLFAGGRIEAPAGTLDLPPFPASAAGPDLRQVVLGSEGRLGILTQATVRVTPVPEREIFPTFFLPTWERALDGARELVQSRLPLSMIRLSTPVETETTLVLAGHPRLIRALRRYLTLRGAGPGRCMLLLGVSGRTALVRAVAREAQAILGRHGAVAAGRRFGREWQRSRFRTPYLRNTLWEMGYATDTVETATTWDRVPTMATALASALRAGLEDDGERVHAFTHLSHVYPTGSSLYTTYLFRLAADPDETLHRWRRLKDVASQAIVEHGGTISHQHGVGIDHAPYLPAEKGDLGMTALHDLAATFDPVGLMNPGKLLAAESHQ